MLRGMPSFDPATITHCRYPLLFQTGETAHGEPLVDAQHPHDLLWSVMRRDIFGNFRKLDSG